MKKFHEIFVLILLTTMSVSCNSGGDAESSSTLQSSELLSSTPPPSNSILASSAPVSANTSSTPQIFIDPSSMQTTFTQDQWNFYMEVMGNYGMIYDVEHGYYAGGMFGYYWANIDEFNLNYLLSWRMMLSRRDKDNLYPYPAKHLKHWP